MSKMDKLLAQANELLGEPNRDRIGATLQNLQDLTGSLAGSRDALAALPQDSYNFV